MRSKTEPLPFRDLTMFDQEQLASELEEASKEMLVYYGIHIAGMSILYEDDEGWGTPGAKMQHLDLKLQGIQKPVDKVLKIW